MLSVLAQLAVEGAHFGSKILALFAPGVHPEECVAVGIYLCQAERGIGSDQLFLRIIDFAGGVAMEDGTEDSFVSRYGTFAGLPACRRGEEQAVPILIKEALPIVVPDSGEQAGAA